ncbi:MAG: hypothetical protein WC508_04450 [Patescibacteria group bacterium]
MRKNKKYALLYLVVAIVGSPVVGYYFEVMASIDNERHNFSMVAPTFAFWSGVIITSVVFLAAAWYQSQKKD